MKTYIIILQLKSPESSYQHMNNYIKAAAYWAKPCNLTWIIKTPNSAIKVRDGIKERILPDDKVLVIAINRDDWGTYNVPKEVTDWMKTNL